MILTMIKNLILMRINVPTARPTSVNFSMIVNITAAGMLIDYGNVCWMITAVGKWKILTLAGIQMPKHSSMTTSKKMLTKIASGSCLDWNRKTILAKKNINWQQTKLPRNNWNRFILTRWNCPERNTTKMTILKNGWRKKS